MTQRKFPAFLFILTLILWTAGIGMKCTDYYRKTKLQKKGERYLNSFVNIDRGLKEAGKRDKKLFIYFYTDWCSYCEKMKTLTFSQPEIKNFLNKKFISAKVNCTNENKQNLVKKYKIKSYPTFLILSPEGEEIGRESGFIVPQKFTTEIGLASVDLNKTSKSHPKNENTSNPVS